MTAAILLLEPSASQAQPIQAALKKDGHVLRLVDTAMAAKQALLEAPADIVLLNLDAIGADGLEMVRDLVGLSSVGSLIALTAQGSVQSAVAAMRAGATDVLIMPVGAEKLRNAVTLAKTNIVVSRRDPTPTLPSPDTADTFFGFIGATPEMRAVYRMIDSAAPSKATVFITGESGTGKEVCADAIHRRSPRASGPFVPINCAAIPKDLMESEIFGHVKGAFTGATSDHAGAALQADRGTLFLDEICEMDLSLQAKLLRFLQTGLVKKVGSERTEAVDVRIVCATNRDPYVEVKAGRFREDLFYRLQVISIELPALRERGDDVLLIARAFLKKFSQEEGKSFRDFGPAATSILRDYAWPGNVRQLMNVVRNVVVLNDGEEIQPFMLPPPLNKPTMIVPPMLQDPRWAAMAGPLPFPFGQAKSSAPTTPVAEPTMPRVASPPSNGQAGQEFSSSAPSSAAVSGLADWQAEAIQRRIRPLWQVENDAIDEAIAFCEGNITRAAALLEINPCTIYRRRQRKRSDA